MRVARVLILAMAFVLGPASALPKNNPNQSPNGLKRCRCDAFDGGPKSTQCYLHHWNHTMLGDGNYDEWVCATSDEPYDTLNYDKWFTCPTLNGHPDPDAKECEFCAQSGARDRTILCPGSPVCYQLHGKNRELQRCDDQSTCPKISYYDSICRRQWWQCGQKPSPQPTCAPNWAKGGGIQWQDDVVIR